MADSISKSLAWSLLEQGGAKAVALVVQIVLARLLEPEAFGVLAILLVVTHIADAIAQSGLGMALIQKKDASPDSFTTAFWLSMGIAVVLYGVIFMAAPAIALLYGMPDLVVTLRALGIVVFFNSANSIQRSFLQKKMDFKSLFVASIVAVMLSGGAGIAAAFAGFGVWALILQTMVQSFASCLVMLLVVPWKPTRHFQKAEARELFSYGWKVCATNLLGTAYDSIADLVIGKACSAEALGYYSQGKRWPHTGIMVVSNVLNNVFFPAFSAMQDDLDRMRRNMRRALQVGSFVTIPFALLLAVTAKSLIALLLTEKWLPSVFVFQLICLGDCFMVVRIVNLRVYMALGYSDVYLKLQTIKVFIGLSALCIAAFLTADINCIALVRACVSLVSVWFVDLVPARKLVDYGRFQQFKDIAPCLGLAIVASIVSLAFSLLQIPYLITLLLQVVAFGAVYVGGAVLLKLGALHDVAVQVKSMVSKGSGR